MYLVIYSSIYVLLFAKAVVPQKGLLKKNRKLPQLGFYLPFMRSFSRNSLSEQSELHKI